ncbi:MAG: carboxypeptidase regulatory-like domain-containing protein, partial [Lentimicrobiaceae bacterium]|nr:carboxypeptidase regulatory-like domain-containing protein [Lentimicrobiaceae bacterium]
MKKLFTLFLVAFLFLQTGFSQTPRTSNNVKEQTNSAENKDETTNVPTKAPTRDCTPITTFPWSESFDATEIPECWQSHDLDGDGTQWQSTGVFSYPSDGRSVRHQYGCGEYQYGGLVSPQISVPTTGIYELKFWSRNEYPEDVVHNSVQISTASDDPLSGDFVLVKQLTGSEVSATWKQITISLFPYRGQDIYFGFLYEGDCADSWYIDEVSIAQSTSIHNPLRENWNAGAPAGWTYSQFSRQTSGGVDNTPCIRAGLGTLLGTPTSGNAVTPEVFMGDDPIMTFELRATTNTGGTTAAPANAFNYRVEVRPAGTSTWTNIWDVPQNAHAPVTADFVTKTVDVSAYANQICQFRFTINRNSGTTYVFIDDVWIGTKPEYQDLTAVSIEGNNLPTVNTSENYTVKVRNSSYTDTEAADYTVKLMKVADPVDIEIGSLPGVFIEPFETEDFVFTWTLTTAGTENIYGEVILISDPDFNPADNQTALMQVLVLTDDPVISVNPQNIDFGMVYNTLPVDVSMVQTITNTGATPLNVTGYTSTDPRVTVTGLPLTVNAGTPQNIEILLDANGLPTGVFSAQLTINSNCSENPTLTVNITANVVIPVSIGDGDDPSNRVPFSLSWYKNLTQSIYYTEEIGTTGLLAGITYTIWITSTPSTNLRNIPVKIWVAEVDVENLNDWVPYTYFTEVFNGNVNFYTTEQLTDTEVTIIFDVPYQYNGGNLVIYAQKFDSPTAPDCYFRHTATPGTIRSRWSIKDAAPELDWENPILGTAAHDAMQSFPNTIFTFDMSQMGTLTGVVESDVDGILEGAKIQVVETGFYAFTDENGAYSFNLSSGNYNIEYSYLGHNVGTYPVVITAQSTTTQNVTLTKFPTVTVSGTVTNYTQDPLANVQIILDGYDKYGPVYTDETGFYSISGVFVNETYNIFAHRAAYQQYTNQVEVETTNLTFDFQLYDYPHKPENLVTDDVIDNPNVVITYEQRNTDLDAFYVLDDGSAESGYTQDIAVAMHYRGNRYEVNEEGEIFSVDIYGVANPNADETQTAYVIFYNENRTYIGGSAPFIIPADGWINVPLNNIPYSDEFYAMVQWYTDGVETNLLGYDTNGPNAKGNGYSSRLQGVYTYWDGPLDFAAMIRVHAKLKGGKSVTYGTGNETRAIENYRIYRLPVGEETNEAAWITLSENVSGLTFTDNTFSTVSTGGYRWAVKAEYTGGVLSEATISDPPIYSADLKANVTVLVTDENNNPIESASVTITNQNNDPEFVYSGKTNSEGICLFKPLKGTYDILVTKWGYQNYTDTDIEIEEDFTLDIELIDIIMTPFNLSVEVDRCDALFTWNTFYSSSYIFDDGSAEDAFAMRPSLGSNYWTGNEFTTGETGYITSIEIVGINTVGYEANKAVILDIFNENREIVASSEEFYMPASGWINVPFNNVPYFGTFYAMLRWPHVEAGEETNYIARDLDGPNASSRIDWLYNGDQWFNYSETAPLWGVGIFLIRANVDITGELTKGKSATYGYDGEIAGQVGNDILNNVEVSHISLDVPFDAEALYSEFKDSNSRMLEGYTIYLNDMEIVSNYPNKEFMFSGLPNGTYTAGVQAVFSTGSSAIIYSDSFEITCEHTVTFIVKDVNNVLINDAVIVLGGETLSGYTTLRPNGTYPYTVSKAGYANATGTVTIFDDDAEVEVTLIS